MLDALFDLPASGRRWSSALSGVWDPKRGTPLSISLLESCMLDLISLWCHLALMPGLLYFPIFFISAFLTVPGQAGKRPQATAIVGGRALRWELRGITINHQLQSLNHPHMVPSPILFFCVLRERKLVYKHLSFSSWHWPFPIYLFVLIHRFSRLPQEIQLQDSKLPLKSCLVFMPSFCRAIRYFIPGAIAIPQVSKLT